MPGTEPTEDARQVGDLTEKLSILGYRNPKAWR
jgi:hypothetical protein